MKRNILFVGLVIASLATESNAQTPVIDNANLGVAQQNATNTKAIMGSNAEIMSLSSKILQAVTGNRSSDAQIGGLINAGLGGGNSVAQAPSWGSLMSGAMSWGGMTGNSQSLASTLINGLNLVKSISGLFNGGAKGNTALDTAYSGSVNTSAMLSALTSQASAGVTARSSTLNSVASQIGSANDVKGSIDQNTQVAVQHAETTNQLIGVTNGAVAALNAEQIRKLTQQSMVAAMLKYEPTSSDPFKK